MHRGRGRPPGSGKKKEGQAADDIAKSPLMSAEKSPSVAANLKKTVGLSVAAVASIVPAKSLHEAPAIATRIVGAPKKEEVSAPAAPTLVVGVKKDARLGTGIDSAIHAIGKFGRRLLKPQESEVLNQVRLWAPLSDLELAMAMLQAQRASLTERFESKCLHR